MGAHPPCHGGGEAGAGAAADHAASRHWKAKLLYSGRAGLRPLLRPSGGERPPGGGHARPPPGGDGSPGDGGAAGGVARPEHPPHPPGRGPGPGGAGGAGPAAPAGREAGGQPGPGPGVPLPAGGDRQGGIHSGPAAGGGRLRVPAAAGGERAGPAGHGTLRPRGGTDSAGTAERCAGRPPPQRASGARGRGRGPAPPDRREEKKKKAPDTHVCVRGFLCGLGEGEALRTGAAVPPPGGGRWSPGLPSPAAPAGRGRAPGRR